MEINFNDLLDALLLTVVASLFIATLIRIYFTDLYAVFCYIGFCVCLFWLKVDKGG